MTNTTQSQNQKVARYEIQVSGHRGRKSAQYRYVGRDGVACQWHRLTIAEADGARRSHAWCGLPAVVEVLS